MNTDALQRMFGIEGKIAVITDSGCNLGPDVAAVLAAAGAKVIIADLASVELHSVVDRINAGGASAVSVATDVEDEGSVVALFNRVARDLGIPDIVVNCAAMNNCQPLTEFTESAWDEVISMDLKSVFFCMREAIRQMKAGARGGRIVNVTTMGALHPVLNGNGAYGAARAGVGGLVRSAALDYAKDNILINNVMPGAVQNKVRLHSDTIARLERGDLTGPGLDAARRRPLGWGRPEDIAAAVLYLVGPSGGYITGTGISLDGGFLLS